MDFKEYQERYFKTNPNYLAVYIANNLEFKKIVDLGCGSGNETVYLLKKGKEVIAVDKDLNYNYFNSRVKDNDKLILKEESFEDFDFPKVDAVLSLFSLSFCAVDKFNELWNKIDSSLSKDGIFAGNLFGKRDTFSSMDSVNTFTKEEVLELLSSYEIIKFKEQEYDQDATKAHRHYYDFVAIKR